MIHVSNNAKNCQTCDKALKGRIDKKFCNDYCRNTFNNYQKMEMNRVVMKVNNVLRKNRNILCALLGSATHMKKIKKERLLMMGFLFEYFTHAQNNKLGTTYYCYDVGYRPLEKEQYLVVKTQDKELVIR